MAIRAVTIDFWNTLYDSSGGPDRARHRNRAVEEQLQRLGLHFEEDVLKAAHKSVWHYFNDAWKTEHRTPESPELVNHFWQCLGVAPDAQAVESVATAFAEGVLHNAPRPMPGALEAVRALAEKYHIALISDTAFSPGRILRRLMERDGFGPYFHRYSFSDETGVSKPHPKAWDAALHGVDYQPSDVVHIGDIERTDIAGARNRGHRALLFAGDPNPSMPEEYGSETSADATIHRWEEAQELVVGM